MMVRKVCKVCFWVLLASAITTCTELSTQDDSSGPFSVSYLPNGASFGTPPSDSTRYEAGQSVTVLGNTGVLSKTGSSFTGWNTAAAGTGRDYTQGQNFVMGSSDMMLYAKWGSPAEWARTVSAGTDSSQINSVAVDGSGNVYAAGYQTGTGTYTYGTQDATGSYSGRNIVLVKYDASGTALWAQTVSGIDESIFLSVAVDGSGNVYAAGYQVGPGTYTYGTQSVAGTYNGYNVILVKYDASGTALWVRSVISASLDSWFHSVAVDSSGNIYAAGMQNGNGAFTYGTKSITGPYFGQNVVLVKYDSSGEALWARTVSTGPSDSQFTSVAVDGAGNSYASGWQSGSGTYTYGTHGATGTSSGLNVVLVKYDTLGSEVWARTLSAGTSSSVFSSVAVDGSGNVYTAGYQYGTGANTYGTKSVAGTYSGGNNVVLVKYNSSGTAVWARSVSEGPLESSFNSVAVDGLGDVYAAGYQAGTGTYTYGSQSAAGTWTGNNAVLVKYDALGTALWTQTVSTGTDSSCFNSVAVDASKNVYAAGSQNGTGTYIYGGQSAEGTSAGGENVVLVKWRP